MGCDQNVFIRSFSVDQSLTTTGEKCGGVVGFLNCVKSWIGKLNPDGIVVCWDGEGGSLRKRKLFPNYKAQRKPFTHSSNPEEASDVKNKLWQLKLIVEILKFFPVCQLYVDNCEADDVIYYVAQKLKHTNKIIVSSDRDFYQLVNEKTRIYSLGKKMLLSSTDIVNELNVLPENFVLYRSITGDHSDNIDGIKGIGPAKFKKLLPMLAEQEVSSFNEFKQIISEKNDVKYNVITNEWDKLERNYELIKLDYAHLSLNQISKIDTAIKNYIPRVEILGIRKKLLESKISISYLESILSAFRQLTTSTS